MITYAMRNPVAAMKLARKADPVPRFILVEKKGANYDIGGEIVELFRIKTFADAMDRTVYQVKRWEDAKSIPRPLYEVENDQCTHWYSAAQIINCHRILHGKYQGRKCLPKAETPKFFADLRAVWNSRDIVVSENGNIGEKCE